MQSYHKTFNSPNIYKACRNLLNIKNCCNFASTLAMAGAVLLLLDTPSSEASLFVVLSLFIITLFPFPLSPGVSLVPFEGLCISSNGEKSMSLIASKEQ